MFPRERLDEKSRPAKADNSNRCNSRRTPVVSLTSAPPRARKHERRRDDLTRGVVHRSTILFADGGPRDNLRETSSRLTTWPITRPANVFNNEPCSTTAHWCELKFAAHTGVIRVQRHNVSGSLSRAVIALFSGTSASRLITSLTSRAISRVRGGSLPAGGQEVCSFSYNFCTSATSWSETAGLLVFGELLH